ncbi:25548_t:CDS:2, partial [Gigaspora rosea]
NIDGGISVCMNITKTSQIMVEINNMSFDIKYMNQIIGKVSSSFSNDNITLSFNGRLLPSNTKEELDAMTNAFFKILSGEELKFTLEARTSSDSWLSSLNAIITKETKINFNYEFIERGWNFKFDPNEQYSPEISLQHEIKYSNLFPLGIYKIPYSLGTIESSFTTKLEIFTEDFKDSFNELAKKIFMAEDVVFTVKGELNLMAKTPVGDIKMEKIQFNFDKNFKYQTQPRILMKSMETVKATRDTIEFKGLATIINPLNVEIELRSNVEFDLLSDQNIKVANMTIENFKLKRKNEDMVVKLKYLPEYDSGHSVIQNYLNRRFSILSIKTNNQTTSVFLLQKFFEVLELKVLLPGIDALFLKEIESLEKMELLLNQEKLRKFKSMDVGNAIVNSTDYFSGVRENIQCFIMIGIDEDKDNLFRINLYYIFILNFI